MTLNSASVVHENSLYQAENLALSVNIERAKKIAGEHNHNALLLRSTQRYRVHAAPDGVRGDSAPVPQGSAVDGSNTMTALP